MGKQSYLSLLILCTVLSQGIAILSGENIEIASNIHSRQRRVINQGANQQPEPHQQQLEPPPPPNDQVRLTVNGRTVCYGRLRGSGNIEANAHIVSYYGQQLRVSIRDPETGIRHNNLRIASYRLPFDFNRQNHNDESVAILELHDIPGFLHVPHRRRHNHP